MNEYVVQTFVARRVRRRIGGYMDFISVDITAAAAAGDIL